MVQIHPCERIVVTRLQDCALTTEARVLASLPTSAAHNRRARAIVEAERIEVLDHAIDCERAAMEVAAFIKRHLRGRLRRNPDRRDAQRCYDCLQFETHI